MGQVTLLSNLGRWGCSSADMVEMGPSTWKLHRLQLIMILDYQNATLLLDGDFSFFLFKIFQAPPPPRRTLSPTWRGIIPEVRVSAKKIRKSGGPSP